MKTHILHVIYKLAMGGLENGLIQLINHLPESEFRHTLFVLTDVEAIKDRIQTQNVEIVCLNKQPGPLYKELYRIYGQFQRIRPDVLHTRNLSTLECQWAGQFAGIPYRLHSEHGRDAHDLQGTSIKNVFLRKAHKPLVHHYLVLSRELEHYLQTKIKISPDKITQIYNGVDTNRFKPNPMMHDEPCLISAGRLDPVKDYKTLIEAFEFVLKEHPRAQLKIMGDGPEKARCMDLCQQKGLTEKVLWLGYCSQPQDVLMTGNVFVQTSLYEGISNTILEAMSCGLPIVATRVGGNEELIESGKEGLLVPAKSPNLLAEKICQLLKNREYAKKLGQQARERVLEAFSVDRMVDQYRSIYSQQPKKQHRDKRSDFSMSNHG